MKKEKNEELKRKSRLMIGLFSFLGIAMIASIAITSFTGKGTYSACVPGQKRTCTSAIECNSLMSEGYECTGSGTGGTNATCTCPTPEPTATPTPTPTGNCDSFQLASAKATSQCGTGNYNLTNNDGCYTFSCKSTPTSECLYKTQSKCETIELTTCSKVDGCWVPEEPNCGGDSTHKVWSNTENKCVCASGYTENGVGTCSPSTQNCQTKTQCETDNPGYLCINGGNGCYTKSSNACYKCTKGSTAYYTYTNEGGCPLAESYSKCASDTQGKNRLYLMEHNTSTGATSVVNVLECVQDANEECKVSPGGTWYHEKTCDRLVSPTSNVTINGDTTWWRCVGGGTIPTDPPGDPTNPTNPPSGETKTCYVCVSGEKSQYVWASSSANAAQAATTLSGITAKNCATTSESNCKGLPVTNCYECNGSKKHVMAESDADAKTKSGGTSCNIVTTDKCNEITPPKTGTFGIIVAWVVGMMTIGYAMWYYKKSSSLS